MAGDGGLVAGRVGKFQAKGVSKDPEACLRYREAEVGEQVEGDDRGKQVRATDHLPSWSWKSFRDDAKGFDLCCRAQEIIKTF